VPPPWPALLRIALIGTACALLVLAGGWILARTRLGADETQARVRVEADVREEFERIAQRLREASEAVFNPTLVRNAAAEESAAARQLFAATRDALRGEDETLDAALTVFDAKGLPIAWAGRPSEPPATWFEGGEGWFFSRAALGHRIVYVRPISDGPNRVGTIVAERPIVPASRLSPAAGGGLQGANTDPLTIPTRLAPVTVHLPGESVGPREGTVFVVTAPSGAPLLTATVAAADILATRERWRRTTWSIALFVLAGAVVLLAGPLLDWRNRARHPGDYAAATLLTAAAIVLARLVARVASPADWSDQPLFSAVDYAGTLFRPLLTSPFDYILTAVTAGGLVGLLLFAVDAWRLRSARHRLPVTTASRRAAYLAMQLSAGVAVAAILIAHQELLRNTIANSRLDLLQFSLQRWNTARLALQIGLVIAHATALGLSVAIVRAALARWSVRRGDWRLRVLTIACWVLPLVVWRLLLDRDPGNLLPLLIGVAVIVLMAIYASRLMARYRHGSQAFRLTLLTLGLIAPAFAFYPTLFQLAWQAKSQLVETFYAAQAMNQRQVVQQALYDSLGEIDQMPNLPELVTVPATAGAETMTDRAFQVWRATALADYPPVTSSVELFGPDGQLVSRFAFNLPEDLSATMSEENSCAWVIFEQVSPFFAEDRRILHAGRRLCGPSGESLGSIVVHAMPGDYENLAFIASSSPYVELLRPATPQRAAGFSGRDVEYAVYGWSGTPLFSSGGNAWPIPDDVFAMLVESRESFWAELTRGDDRFDVFLLNNRGGIYALGFPVASALDHLVHLAELTVLAVLTYVLLLAANAAFGALSRRGTTAPALLREIRASFYRKLFLAFIAAVFVPVVLVAVGTRVYVADRLRSNIEDEAVDTARAAARVVEDLVAPRAAQAGIGIDDNLMVWVSRVVDQDVNMFLKGRLVATSERNLFASGFLPTRTPAEVHEGLMLRREAATVVRERVGGLNPYLVAGTPLFEDRVLTVPLTTRQQEIEQEIETLDRRVLLAALIFMLGGALLGYVMAERISDPVNRLTRATRRIARGDLDARIAATSSDELRRLVEDFNSMAGDLQRQRGELERTHRLEAWAEMARQVAHEIKNPLTPIQLNAEHLRRVHTDRGEPLSPVLQECVATILTQVKLLRQIASEFSSFAGSPTAKPASVDVPEMLHEVVAPYRVGLATRIRFDVDVPEKLPPVYIDRTLISRSLTNIVENALHAMPGTGTLSVMARADDHHVRIRVADTGVGMDAEALARAFEPYFSTKASGTGLGLPIAKRNVELTGGTITVSSERDRGTTVELMLPVARSSVGRRG
jgi:signal transduction histidine kinase